MSAGERLEAARRLLAERGPAGARVEAAGDGGDIAAIRVDDESLDALLGDEGARLSEALRALGFRHVAVDLG